MNLDTTHGTALRLHIICRALQNLRSLVRRTGRALASGLARHWRATCLPGHCGLEARPAQWSSYRDGRWQAECQRKALAALGAKANLSRPALIVQAPARNVPEIISPLSEVGVASQKVSDLRKGVRALQDAADAWSFFVVDIDGSEDLDEILDRLLALRRKVPHVPVLLLSGDFSQSDFGEERLPLCDASLRTPITASRLLEALTAATENNRIWRARTTEMNRESSLALVAHSPKTPFDRSASRENRARLHSAGECEEAFNLRKSLWSFYTLL